MFYYILLAHWEFRPTHFNCNFTVSFQIRPHTSTPPYFVSSLFILIALLLQFVLPTWNLTNIPLQDEDATTLNKLILPTQKPLFFSSYSGGGGSSWPPLPTMLKCRLAWGFFFKMHFTFNYVYVSVWGHKQVCVGSCKGQSHQNPWSWSHMPLWAAHYGYWDPNSDILWGQSESLIAEPPHHPRISKTISWQKKDFWTKSESTFKLWL